MKKIVKLLISRIYPILKPFLYFYRSNADSVKVLIFNKSQLLLIKNTYTNGWSLPGGGIKKNELTKDAAIREVYEEVGIKINYLKKLGQFKSPDNCGNITVFSCYVKSNHFKIDNLEIEDAKWVEINKIVNMKLLPAATKCIKMI